MAHQYRTLATGLLCALAFVAGGTAAYACPPPPPPPARVTGETAEAYKARLAAMDKAMRAAGNQALADRQKRAWDSAALIFIARVEQVRPVKLTYYGPGQTAQVKVLRWIKGKAKGGKFWISYKGETSCGPVGGGDAVDGKVGELFVVMASGAPLSSARVIDSFGAARAFDLRIRAALE